MLDDPLDYELSLSGGWYCLSRGSKECKFSAPATTRGVAKLYTISCDDSLLYVGIAKQPMASRLSFGFKANGSGGYHGYKWKFLETNLKLSIWTGKINGVYAPLHVMETIEAEVAFACRHLSGQWPTHQHEIHFSPSEQWHRDAAVRIYNHAIACNR
ncbi:hypothetical protein [Pelobacter seleniigenes]|uniref:hypothetical protein n=1 Tax=Pelobacter seleniigenes TaxID=407188 RepID=UPI0012B7B365|nr:hypothetical protein [Pelobacter seleniigenes]